VAEAVDEYEKVLADARRMLGPNHQLTMVIADGLKSVRRPGQE
jgi:hypothetical protein